MDLNLVPPMQDDDAEIRAREKYNMGWNDLGSKEQDIIQVEYDEEHSEQIVQKESKGQIMDDQTKRYREAQFEKLAIEYSEYKPKIKIVKPNGETNWLDIEEDEFKAIKHILTDKVKI